MRRFLRRFIGEMSVRKLIVLIFTLEIVIFAIGIGYVSYSSGYKTVIENSRQLSRSASDHIAQMVLNYLEEPDRLGMIHKEVILNGTLDFSKQKQRDAHFVEMLDMFPHVINTYVVLDRGYEFGARREDDGGFLVWDSNQEQQSLDYYKYDELLGRQEYVKSLYAYNPAQRPAYVKATAMKEPSWTDVYNSATGRGLVITRTIPLYTEEKKLLGVSSCSLLLAEFNEFLKSLNITENSSVFILSKNEEIIAAFDARTALPKKKTELLKVSDNPLLDQGIRALKANVAQLNEDPGNMECSFDFNGEKYFLYADRIKGNSNPHWMNIILIPEKDMTMGLYELAKRLIGIVLLAFVIAILNSVLAVRYLIAPLNEMNRAAGKIADGDFSYKIKIVRHDEVGRLVQSINAMSTKLENQFAVEKKAAEAERKMREQAEMLQKSAQAISGEIEIKSIFEKISNVLLEDVGAQHMCFMAKKEGRYEIVVEGYAEGKALQVLSGKVADGDSVPMRIVEDVAKAHAGIVLHNAAETGCYTDDEYILKHQCKSIICMPILSKGLLKGIIYLENNLTKNAFAGQQVEILNAIASQLAITLENAYLYEDIKCSNEKLSQMLQKSISALSRIAEIRDAYTAGHQRNVQQLACAIAKEMGIPEDRMNNIYLGALIHDIGKVYLPTALLTKPGKLTDIECQMLKTHVNYGYQVMKAVDFPLEIQNIIKQHHECLDGSGYPEGISGAALMLESRIVSVADVVEATSSRRPYRPGMGIDAALHAILEHRGSKYDPAVVDACVRLFREKGFMFIDK